MRRDRDAIEAMIPRSRGLRGVALGLGAALLAVAAAGCKGSSGGAASGAASGVASGSASGSTTAAAATTGAGATTGSPADPAAEVAALAELAQHGPDAKAYPQADAVVALERDDIALAADGTITEHHKSIVKILDAQRGKQKFADVHIPFDAKRQQLAVALARTITGDGVAHAASGDEIGDIVPPQLADATIYSDVRERVVSFPAVDTGTVVELEYTRTTPRGPDAPGGGETLLGGWDPAISRVVTISAPEGTTPKVALEGVAITPTESSSGGVHTWTYALAQQPDRHPEWGSLEDAAVLPRLVYGFAPDWKSVVAPVAERFLAAATPSPMPPAVKSEADRVVAGAADDRARALALFRFVAHDVRSIELPLGWAGYQPHSPDVVLANRYADQRDKVGLLLALCAAEGIAGKPVFVRTGKVPVEPTVPTVAQFDRVIARLTVDGKDVWLDPADDSGQFGVAYAGQDNFVLPIERGGAELGRRPLLDPSTSVSRVAAAFTLGADGALTADYHYDLTGWYADRATGELRPLQGARADTYFAQAASSLGANAVDHGHHVGDLTAAEGALHLDQQVAVARYSAEQGRFRVFELPVVALPFASMVPSSGMEARAYPLYLGTPRTEVADRTVAVPSGWKIAYVPPALTGKTDGLRYASECKAEGQKVTCHDELVLDRVDLSPAQYPGYRAAMQKLDAYERRVVLLTRG